MLTAALFSGLLIADARLPGSHVESQVHLLAQASGQWQPPQAGRSAQLQLQIDQLNERIGKLNTNWPTGAIVLTVIGAVLSGLGLVTGAVFALALLAFGAGGAAALLVWGAFTLAGLPFLLPGVIWGSTAAANARRDRDSLIKERDALQTEGPGGSVDPRQFGPPRPQPMAPEVPPQVQREHVPVLLAVSF